MKKILLGLLMILWGGSAWAVYPSYTVCPSSCDFSTLNGALADIVSNHASFSQDVTVTISGSWAAVDTTAASTSGLTMNGHFLTITATGTARTTGVYQATGAYSLSPATGTALNLSSSNVTVDGIQIVNGSSTFSASINVANFNSGITIKNCMMLMTNNTAGSFGISFNNPRGTNLIYNNVGYVNGATIGNFEDWFTANSSAGDGSTTVKFYNNTVYNVYDGIDSVEATIAVQDVSNNVIMKCTDVCYVNHGSGFTTGSYNFSSDTSATNAPFTNGTGSLTTYASYFTSPGTDFHLLTGSPFIAAAGNNFTSTFSTDIAGTTRQASGNWDAGAFFYLTPGPFVSSINGATLNGVKLP